jgi:hypothetical protein
MSMPQLSLSWPNPAQATSSFDDQENNYYDYSPITAESNHEGAFLRDMNFEVPRWIPNEMTGNVISDSAMSLDSFEPSAYVTHSNKLTHHHVSADFLFNSLENARDFSRLSLSGSPPPKQEHNSVGLGVVSFDRASFRLPSNDISEDGEPSSREMTVVDGDDHPVDEPYAKLIHRALMSAPNHSMVLQEIYQWFRENTTKGSSDSKGWMNSIRHNLSMNAVRLLKFFVLCSALLTKFRLSRKQSGRSLVMKRRNLLNGSWRTSPSEMVSSLQRDIAKALMGKNS